MIKVAIIEDNSGFRQTLERLLKESPGFTCVGTYEGGEQALGALPAVSPDVVLMDLNMPDGLSGIETTRRLKELLPELNVLVVTAYKNPENIFDALSAGACGYLLKRSSAGEILEAIREVVRGGAPMSSEIARQVVNVFRKPVPGPQLSESDARLAPREVELLDLLTQGLINKEIADRMNLTVETVRWYLKQIYGKLHVRTRTEAAMKHAATRGLSTSV